MSKYEVTIKLTTTYTYEADDVTTGEEAIAEAFRYRRYWYSDSECEEFSAIAKRMDVDA